MDFTHLSEIITGLFSPQIGSMSTPEIEATQGIEQCPDCGNWGIVTDFCGEICSVCAVEQAIHNAIEYGNVTDPRPPIHVDCLDSILPECDICGISGREMSGHICLDCHELPPSDLLPEEYRGADYGDDEARPEYCDYNPAANGYCPTGCDACEIDPTVSSPVPDTDCPECGTFMSHTDSRWDTDCPVCFTQVFPF